MAKHRRWADKKKSNSIQKEETTQVIEGEKIEPPTVTSTPKDLKSIIQLVTKYGYIVAAAALLSGIFTPLTLGIEFQDVILGMWAIFVGVGGGILIFLGTKNDKFRSIKIIAGLGMMIGSLIIIHELAERPILN
tara:strand:+ start:775 stop:1176 length:402 start_codon:yes stop_codon:yes gene_type:complete